jgi:hypothetical protein
LIGTKNFELALSFILVIMIQTSSQENLEGTQFPSQGTVLQGSPLAFSQQRQQPIDGVDSGRMITDHTVIGPHPNLIPVDGSRPPQTTVLEDQKLSLRPIHKYLELAALSLSLLAYALETTLNAAIAIFGIGVGVGLILGDSFRAVVPVAISSVAAASDGGSGSGSGAPTSCSRTAESFQSSSDTFRSQHSNFIGVSSLPAQ